MFESIGQAVSKYPRVILLAWALLVLLAFPWSQRSSEVLSNELGSRLPDSEERFVRQVFKEHFVSERKAQLILTATAINDSLWAKNKNWLEAQSQLEETLTDLQNVSGVINISDNRNNGNFPSFSEVKSSSLALIQLNTEDIDIASEITKQIKSRLPNEGLLAYYLTGTPAINLAFLETVKRDTRRAEFFGLPMSLLVLIVAFGAIVAASLPLFVALMSISLSFAVLFIVGQFLTLSAFVQTVVTMLGMATGIDYALLMVNRFREELFKGYNPKEAAIVTIKTAGKAVALSGLTVVIALTALLIPPLSFVRSVGLASMTVIFFSVFISLTALPAIFYLLGKRINLISFSRRTLGQRSRGFWESRTQQVLKRPFLWVSLGLLILLSLSYPIFSIQAGFSGVDGLTENTDVHKAQTVLEDLELDGLLRSFDLIIDFEDRGFFHPSSVNTVAKLTRNIENLNNVTTLYSPTKTSGILPLLRQQYYATQELAMESPLRAVVKATVSQNGQYALLRIFPKADVLPKESRVLASEIRNLVQEIDVNTFLGGDYAFEHDWITVLYKSFPYALLIVYAITFILLGLAFHSILIPLKSIVLNTLTVSAAFGVIVFNLSKGLVCIFFWFISGLGFCRV